MADSIIQFSDTDVAKAQDFAASGSQHTYNRRGVSPEEQQRDVFIGKLGEIAFAKFLAEHGKALTGSEDMFTVWADTRTVDNMDFQTTDGKTVDVKTASEAYHTRILVPHDQYTNQPKDYYVGVRIHQDRKSATIEGFATHGQLRRTGVGHYPNFGIALSELQPIALLIEQMPTANG